MIDASPSRPHWAVDLYTTRLKDKSMADPIRIPLVYVAGPYRAPLPYQRGANINAAWLLGCKVAELGGMPVIPHKNTEHMDGLQSDDFWLEGTLELMRRCDAVIVTSDWERSTGAVGEEWEAQRLSIPVFYGLATLEGWIREFKGGLGTFTSNRGQSL